MPDRHSHRGPDPEDDKLFAPDVWPELRLATSDLCWLLTRGYSIRSAGELVGNRYSLARRQRIAVARCACSEAACQRRQAHRVEPDELLGRELWIDGYNVLIGIEAALAGGVILSGCDHCYRDMATIYARYRVVEETIPALRLIGELTSAWSVSACRWWIDRPVSNSGRFKELLLELAAARGWNWPVELVFNPDKVLAESVEIVASSDSLILDRCGRWVNLARLLVSQYVPHARVVGLCPHSSFPSAVTS